MKKTLQSGFLDQVDDLLTLGVQDSYQNGGDNNQKEGSELGPWRTIA